MATTSVKRLLRKYPVAVIAMDLIAVTGLSATFGAMTKACIANAGYADSARKRGQASRWRRAARVFDKAYRRAKGTTTSIEEDR